MDLMGVRWARAGHEGLLRELDAALAWCSHPGRLEATAPSVSGWGVGQHLEHLWHSDRGVVRWLGSVRDGRAEGQGRGWTAAGALVLWVGWIPRGRARAPASTEPRGADANTLLEGLRSVRHEVQALGGQLDELGRSTVTLRHPVLGFLTAAHWLRFLHIHHRHHRRIMEDILAG